MGLLAGLSKGLSSVGNIVGKTIIEPVGNTVLKALGKAPQTYEDFTSSSKAASAYNKVLGAATTAAAVGLTGGTALGRTAATKVAQATAANPIKATAVVATGIVATNVLKESEKAREAVVSAPSSLANIGSNIGKVVENPSAENVKALATENPVILGAAAIVGGAAATKALAPVIGGALTREAIQEQTEALIDNPNLITVYDSSGKVLAQQEIAPSTPITPATQPINTSTNGKKRKARKKQPLNIIQKVNVKVSNSANNRFINKRCYV